MTESGFRSFGLQLDFLRALMLHDERGDGPVPCYIITHSSSEVSKTTIRRLLQDECQHGVPCQNISIIYRMELS